MLDRIVAAGRPRVPSVEPNRRVSLRLGIELACVAAIAPRLASRFLPRGTIAHAAPHTRLGSGKGG